MFLTRVYYTLKPFIPLRMRLALRRHHVRRILRRHRAVWPINESAGAVPEGWPGWPDRKRFAVVLTHDVEGSKGVARVKQLAALEMELGFRSCFNFIPEGEYSVPAELREWLVDNGFEIGVHDLHHDGKLYSSEKTFANNAKRINRYLDEWNAVGFRSGFMLHNLEWLHQLEILYDASTFDTDPFEPQPDAANTIFPFWVPRASQSSFINHVSAEAGGAKEDHPSSRNQPGSGYIELPYTLPQDSTLFFLLHEKSIDVWIKKLEWIVEKRGMALLNVHPDYTSFDDKVRPGVEFSAERYREFLQHLRNRFVGQYWHALPREIARFSASFRPHRPTRNPKNICMLAFTSYQGDARVVRYAQTLRRRGDHVDVIAYAPQAGVLGEDDIDGVKLFKIQRRYHHRKEGAVPYLLPLIEFFLRSCIFLTMRHCHRRYDLIHVHNIPEFLVFAAWLPKLSGARILLDIHDLVPELFISKFTRGKQSILGPLLKTIESASCRFADHVIISNHLWRDKLVSRSVPNEKCSVFFNNIDPDLFFPHPRTRRDQRKIVIFPGSLQWHQGVDIAINAFPRVLERCPDAEFHIYGGAGIIEELKALVGQLRLEKKVLFCGTVSVKEIPALVANADLGVVPKRANSFGNEAYSTKIMEFMSQGIPVVISRTAIDTYYFDESHVRFCESGDVEAFAEAIIELLTNETLRKQMVKSADTYVARNHWGNKKQEYLDLVDGLIGGIDASLRFARAASGISTSSPLPNGYHLNGSAGVARSANNVTS